MNVLQFTVCAVLSLVTEMSAVRIGIVGGGVGGASAAYYLRQLFRQEADIQLFEMNRIGGRLDVGDMNGYRFETGGSVIHTKNKYMMELIDKFGLQRKSAFDGTFGLYDGQQLVFVSSSWPGVTMAKLFWRYGYDVIRLRRLLAATLDKFSSIYDLLDSGAAYDTVEDLVMAMDPSMVKLTGLPLAQYLKLSGFQEGFIQELVTAVTLTNYGQRPTYMHALVGMVALAGSGDELTSVVDGNYQVAVRAVEASGAIVHREHVQTVNFTGGGYLVTSSDGAGHQQSRVFDVLVVAAPQTEDQRGTLSWYGVPVPLSFPGRYHNLSVTLVDGQLRPAAFSAASLPSDVLCTAGCSEFNSIGTISPVNESDDTHGVHKIFSNAPLTDEQMEGLFSTVRRQRRLSWLAYPEYSGQAAPLGNFTLQGNLYYLNSVERAASAMEMSVIAARNVANMAYTRWYNRPPPDTRRVEHTEL